LNKNLLIKAEFERAKIIKIFCFKKTAIKRLPLKIFLFLLSFSLFFVLGLSPVFCALDGAISQEQIILEAKRENKAISKILLQQKMNQEIAAKKALAEANKQIALDNKFRIKQERVQKVIEKKIAAANNKLAVLAQLQKEREEKLAQKKSAAEIEKKAALAKKSQLQKEREEKLAQKKESQVPESLKGTSDYITIKIRPLNDILGQAQQLFKNGKYEDALATYNYAYDIAKDRLEKKDILKKKSEIKSFITNWKSERVIAEKKILQEVEQSTVLAKKSQLQKEREEKLAQNKSQLQKERKEKLAQKESAAKARRKAYLAKIAQLRKEYREKEALNIEDVPLGGSLITEYMCDAGVAAYKSGKYKAALSEFDKVLLVEPNNQVAKNYRKSALDMMGQSKYGGAN
jgi:hypothetical protein